MIFQKPNSSSKKLTIQKATLIHENKKVSSLYSEYIYRSTPKNSLHGSNSQKYKQLYQHEKKYNNQLLQAQKILQEQKKKLIHERQLFSFTIDTLMTKITIETNQKHHTLNYTNNQNIAASEQSENYQPLTAHRRNRAGKLHKTANSTECNQNIKKLHKYSRNQVPNLQKLQALQILRCKLHETESDFFSLDTHKKSLQNESNLRQEHQRQLKILQEQINSLKLQQNKTELVIQEQNQVLLSSTNQIQELRRFSKDLQETLQEQKKLREHFETQSQNLSTSLNESRTKNLQQENTIKILNTKIKITEEEFRMREEKQLECVQILRKFTNQLQITDEKIQEFLNHQVGMDQSDVTRACKSYQQYISYILHLCKKKDAIYDEMVNQFRENLLEYELRLGLADRRAEQYRCWHNQVVQYANSIVFEQKMYQKKLRELIRLIKSK